MTDHNRDESENDGEKGSQIDDDNRSEHELVEGVDGNDTARIAQTITEYSRLTSLDHCDCSIIS